VVGDISQLLRLSYFLVFVSTNNDIFSTIFEALDDTACWYRVPPSHVRYESTNRGTKYPRACSEIKMCLDSVNYHLDKVRHDENEAFRVFTIYDWDDKIVSQLAIFKFFVVNSVTLWALQLEQMKLL
jgi:hypothetical protein